MLRNRLKAGGTEKNTENKRWHKMETGRKGMTSYVTLRKFEILF